MSSDNLDAAIIMATLKNVMLDLTRMDDRDLSNRQLGTMMLIYTEDGPQTVRAVAERLAVSKPAITRAMDKLEELGLAQRKEDPTDRRSVVLGRTPQGRTFMRDLEKTIKGAFARASAPAGSETKPRKAA